MTDNPFKAEVVNIVGEQIEVHRPGKLSEEQRTSLDDAVYDHINSLFPTDHGKASKSNTQRVGLLQRITTFLSIKSGSHRVGLAFATIAFMAIGGLAFFSGINKSSTTRPSFPQTLASANLDQYVQPFKTEAKSVVPSALTPQRLAFLTGVSQAGIDAVGDPDSPRINELALNYAQYTGATSEPLVWLNTNVEKFEADSQLNRWLIQGYTVEVVSLAASRSMEDIDTSYLHHALEFYRVTTPAQLYDSAVNEAIPERLLAHHKYLASVDLDDINTPSEIQSIRDKSSQMKILAR